MGLSPFPGSRGFCRVCTYVYMYIFSVLNFMLLLLQRRDTSEDFDQRLVVSGAIADVTGPLRICPTAGRRMFGAAYLPFSHPGAAVAEIKWCCGSHPGSSFSIPQRVHVPNS